MKKLLVMTMGLVAAAYSSVFAQKPAVVASNENGWTHIGHTTASFKTQNESISVLGADEFTALKIKVTEAGLQLERMQVFYESGDMEEIDLRNHFAKGSESAAIQLKHHDRDIEKVAFTYKTLPNTSGEKADIDLYGLKTGQPAGKDSFRDEKAEIKEEVNEAEAEVKEEAREAEAEAEAELKEEANEAEAEINEESREAKREMSEAYRKTERELNEEGIEVEVDDDRDANDPDLGDRIEEGAKDATAAVVDRKIKNRVGPGNETAYVDDEGRIYIINNLGEKQFITRMQLKKKPDNK